MSKAPIYKKVNKLTHVGYELFVHPTGTKNWFLNGRHHREDGPAVEFTSGNKYWFLNGEPHREDGPAVEKANGSKMWWLNGQRHRVDGPAIEYIGGDKEWYIHGIQISEEEFNYLEGNGKESEKKNRNKAPVYKKVKAPTSRGYQFCIDNRGIKNWYKDGLFHREDGPAEEWPDGTKFWYLDGIEIPEEEFNKRTSIKPQKIDSKVKVLKDQKYLFLDTETGGLSEKEFDILSIGYLVVSSSLRVLEKGEILIKANPARVSSKALELNGIDLKVHNKNAFTRKKAVEYFNTVLQQYWGGKKPIIAGSNVPFDVKFVKALYTSVGLSFEPNYAAIDIKSMWQGLMIMGKVGTADSSQDTILDYLKVKSKGERHSALVDAENVLKILKKLKKTLPSF